jgi:PAS domain S-box-containing protein
VLRRLEHEYSLRTRLDPAWAVVPLALVREKGQTMLVLDDPGGQPLDALLERPLELTEFLRISIGLANALGKLHERGIIHRDVKPANVTVDTTSSRVWLTGFGIASDLPRERQAPEPPETIAGTLAYMAPEQTGRMNRSIDSRSDLYSLGVTLYEMLTGTLPFAASDPVDWVHCHIARRPPPPTVQRKEVPEAVSAIVLKLLAKTAEERYQTAAGLEADLRKCLGDWESLKRIRPILPGVHDASNRLLIPEKLYGRDREIKALLEAFDRVKARGTPELVLVSGYSGIGKSSVINELHKVIALPRGIFISGKFDQYKRDIPYATLAQAFENLVRQILSKKEAEVERWRDTIRDAVGLSGQLVVNLLPELELIIGKQAQLPELPPQEAQNRFQVVLRAFLGVFARKEHPLALFIDDLQWMDSATLKFLEDLITHPDIRHLLLIGAYRDNEVSPSHSLMLMLDSIRKTNAIVRDIVLPPLSVDDVGRLIAETLHQERTRTETLARLVYEKTAGNPFFVIQFLTALAQERLLEFDPRKAAWRWNVDQIRARRITDNAVDLMVGKLNRLPDTIRETLKRLACLGSNAEVAAMTMIHEGSEKEMHADLRKAAREGLVIHVGDSYEFVHDRVQEAAYSLIPDEIRAEVHLRIGRLLTARMPPDKLSENIFDVVNQLNRGAALISDLNEKQRVAQLNLRAGRKAKTSAAYAAARSYFSVGMTLLGCEGWESQPELTFGLWLERAECAFLCGNFDETEGLLAELVKKGASKSDKAAAYRLRIDLHVMRSEHSKAVGGALECLHLFGIEMSAHPTWEEVESELEKVWCNLGERSIESLINLPPMTDPEMQAAVRVLSVLASPAYFTDQNLLCLFPSHIVNLSLKYGITDASAHGFAYFGFILGPAFRLYGDGYRFAKLGVDLVERHGFVAFKAKAYLTMAWVAIWTQPVTTALGFLRVAFAAAVEAGDFTYACYSYYRTVTNLLARGDHLDEVWRESEKGLHFVRKAKIRHVVASIKSQQQFIESIQGRAATFCDSGDTHSDEDAFETEFGADRPLVCWYWILKLQGRFILGNYEAAFAAVKKAKVLLWAATGCIQLLDYHYYAALTIATLFETAQPDRQREWHEELQAHAEQLREWAENYPPTFLDKHALVLAEVARLNGRSRDAMLLYEQAIRCARENGFIQNEGIANEAAAKFYLESGFETIGHALLRNARYCYRQWGAHAKVRQLDQVYPGLEEPASLGPTTTMGAPIEHLDLMTMVKALQAVSREIDLGRLTETLMVIALEQAGAERGLLFLSRSQELVIEAEATTSDANIQVVLAQAFATLPKFPESILRYVVRTRDRVILDDASAESPFSHDDYVRVKCPRSILCVPLVKMDALIGVLYLENNLTPRVFTSGRLAVLELLASQAAISLENARLYAELRQENCDRSKAEEALRASEERWRKLFENSSAGIALLTQDGHFIAANLTLQKILGYSEEELEQLTPLDLTYEEDRASTKVRLAELAEGQRRQHRIEKRIVHKDGRLIWIDLSTVYIPAAGNTPALFSAVVVDITERKQAELEAARQRTDLAHAARLTMVGELTASIAHELGQPLGAILSNTETAEILLKSAQPHLEGLQEILADIRKDDLRASDVIRRMSGLLRKRELELKPIDLNKVTSDVLRLADFEANRRSVNIEKQFADALPVVRGDVIHLQQVLLNLILNGLEALSESSESDRRLTVRTAYDGEGNVEVAVQDSGRGILPDRLPQLFDSFFTTKAHGMGLGLSIVRSIVEAHGGQIRAENNPGGGACFRFTLPVNGKA